MGLLMKKEALIQNPEYPRRHVVLLGAGASRAAFPNGEATSKHLPLMDDFTKTLELTTLLNNAGIDPNQNFESLYSNINDDVLRNTLEEQINKYFSSLSLPASATDYDRLLLSLREKDAVFTFNWDPFLFDAWYEIIISPNYQKYFSCMEMFALVPILNIKNGGESMIFALPATRIFPRFHYFIQSKKKIIQKTPTNT